MPEAARQAPAAAFDKAVERYLLSRRERVRPFVEKHFSFKGALRLNGRGLSSDLYKVPLNVFWALPYTVLKLSSALAKKAGLGFLHPRVKRLPPGFQTQIQRELSRLIVAELLELPCTAEKGASRRDALFEEMLKEPELSALFGVEPGKIPSKSKDPKFRSALDKNLVEFARSRTAVAELTGNAISLSLGAGLFGKMTPGAMTTGGAIASAFAHCHAVSNFVLGSFLGSLYYGLFPAAASTGLVIASTALTMAALALLTTFSGVAADPLLSKLGVHEKRLHRLIDCLERELKGRGNSRIKIKDQYVARVFDLLDLLKRAAKTIT